MSEGGVGNAHLIEVGVTSELMQGGDLRLPAKAPEFHLIVVWIQHDIGLPRLLLGLFLMLSSIVFAGMASISPSQTTLW